MNSDALKLAATQLRSLLEHYQHQERAAAMLLQELDGLITRAMKKEITTPMEPRDIPGHRYFTETQLGAYRDLEELYASFYVELIDGRASKAFQMLQAKMNKP